MPTLLKIKLWALLRAFFSVGDPSVVYDTMKVSSAIADLVAHIPHFNW
ncbi:MAG: hypothetical protein KME54_00130 [Tolypothrix brevis GSE-NOS-MK-07-07A]|nr:hypothetical protein [Tolypothrix brevis GSE-NOS-MK-07-07A]